MITYIEGILVYVQRHGCPPGPADYAIANIHYHGCPAVVVEKSQSRRCICRQVSVSEVLTTVCQA